MIRRPPRSTLFPHTTLSRSLLADTDRRGVPSALLRDRDLRRHHLAADLADRDATADRRRRGYRGRWAVLALTDPRPRLVDRKSTRLNSRHSQISHAVFCLKKKRKAIALAEALGEVPQAAPLAPAPRATPLRAPPRFGSRAAPGGAALFRTVRLLTPTTCRA